MGSSSYTLNIPVVAGDPRPLKDIAAAVQEIASRTKVTASEFKIFEAELNRGIATGGKYATVVKDLAKSFANSTPALRNLTRELADHVGSLDKAGKAAGNARTEFMQLQKVIFGFNPRLGGLAGLSGSLAGGFGAGIAVGGAALVAGVVETTRKLAEYGREMVNLAARTGLGIQETERFAAIAKIAGVNVESLVTAQRTLTRALAQGGAASKTARSALAELGLTGKVAFEEPQKALEEILSALGNVQNATERERLAVTLLGRGGLELLPLAGQFKELTKQAEGLSIVLDERTVKSANRMAQAFSRAALEIKGAFLQAAAIAFGFDESKTGANYLRLGTGYGASGYTSGSASGVTTGPVETQADKDRIAAASAQRAYETSQRIQRVLSGMSTPRERNADAIQAAKVELDAAVERNDLKGVQAAKQKLEVLKAQTKEIEKQEQLQRHRSELYERLTMEGGAAGRIARFQYEYRDLANSPDASQRDAYQRALLEVIGRPAHGKGPKPYGAFGPSQAVGESYGAASRKSAAEFLFNDFAQLNPIALPPPSASLVAASAQSTLRYHLGLSALNPLPHDREDLKATIAAIQEEERAREQQLRNEKDSADKLGKIADLRQQYLNKIQDAEESYNLSLQRQAQQQAYGFGSGVAGLVMSAQNGGSRGTARFFRGFGENIEGTAITNFAANYVWPMLKKDIPHANSGFLGTILSGTPFGPKRDDLLKISTDINSRSTDLNTAAVVALSGALTGTPVNLPAMPSASLGPGTSGLSGSLATFGSDIGGWTGGALKGASGVIGAVGSLTSLFTRGSSNSDWLSSQMPSAPGLPPGSGLSLPDASTESASVGSVGKWAAVAGIAGAAGAAYKGISDISSPVPGRKVAGAGELAGAAGGAMSLLPLLGASAALGPIGMGIAAAGALIAGISSLFGVGPQDRQRDIQKNLAANAFMAPMAQNVMMSTNGGYADISETGDVRTSNLSPFPVVSQPYLDFPRRIVVPGHIISPFGGYSNQTGALVSPQQPGVTINIHAIDSQSFMDHADAITSAVNHAVQSNYHPLIQNIGQRLGVR